MQTAHNLNYLSQLAPTALSRIERQGKFLQLILHALTVDNQVELPSSSLSLPLCVAFSSERHAVPADSSSARSSCDADGGW